MQNRSDEISPISSNAMPADPSERLTWTKPILEVFAITAATRNAGIINLDLDHALDIS
jgi:hypothetical protein